MTLLGIEPATFRLIDQCPNELRHPVALVFPNLELGFMLNVTEAAFLLKIEKFEGLPC
jgi:hypothetical protein